MGKDLRQYLQVVREAGRDYYREVKKPLKPRFEVCVLQEKLAAEGRFPALYCPQIEGSMLPLVTNLFGSYDGWALAFGINTETMKKVGGAAVLQEYRKRYSDRKPVKKVLPTKAPVKDIILKGKDVDLGILPIPHHAPLDSGKYITIGNTICKHPDTGIHNVGVYREEVKGKDKLGCAMLPSNHGGYIARRYAELGKPMEVAIFIGHHPLVVLGSLSRGDINESELEIMGGLLQEQLEVTRGETVDLLVPARAEIVIEGVIDPREMVTDGPLAEYTGYYGEGGKPCYLIQVTAITMRKDAIYHDLDPAHIEHPLSPVLALESSAYDAVKRVVPTVKAVHIFPSTAGARVVGVSIQQRVPGEARLAGLAAVGDPLVRQSVVVDDDIDLYNEKEVLWAVGTRVVADVDVLVVPRALGLSLDPTSYDETRFNHGTMITKVVIDATRPVGQPFATRIAPDKDLWESMNLADYVK